MRSQALSISSHTRPREAGNVCGQAAQAHHQGGKVPSVAGMINEACNVSNSCGIDVDAEGG